MTIAIRLREFAGPSQPNLLTDAADEIDRLTAELEAARAPAPPCSVNADGHDSGTTRAPQE